MILGVVYCNVNDNDNDRHSNDVGINFYCVSSTVISGTPNTPKHGW
jgi:hypothetical protein